MTQFESAQPELPNELDLSRYLKVLRRFWWVIAAAGIVGAVLAFAYSALHVSYGAESALGIVRTGLLVNLDARARTVSDTDPNAQSLDQLSRRRSLLVIGQSQDLAQRVLEAMGSSLPPGLDTPERIARRVDVWLDNDVVRIQVTMPSAEQAALLANTYAQVFEQRVNILLGESGVSDDALQAQVDQARATYREKQTAITSFIASSPTEALRRRADVLSRELDARTRLQFKLAQLEQDVLALQARLQNGETRAIVGAQLAQLLLEANTFNNESDSLQGALGSAQVNVSSGQAEDLTAAEQAQTLDGLLQAIRVRSQTLAAQDSQPLLDEWLQKQADMDRANAQLKELQADRDLAWNAYQLLATKVSESSIASGYQNQIVRIISPAVVPSSSNATRQPLTILIGAALGIIVGVVLAFVLEQLPFGKKHAAQAETVTTADAAAR